MGLDDFLDKFNWISRVLGIPAFAMSVKHRQARWAEYHLCRSHFKFGPQHRWFDKRNQAWAAKHGCAEVPM